MAKSRAQLTELEGTILGFLKRETALTPYRIRKIFRASASAEWSGSAGAIYPAIHRLVDSKLIRGTKTGDRRGSLTYSLTTKGAAALDGWMCDASRAAGPGVDPFRSRAPLWTTLPRKDWNALKRRLQSTLRARIAGLRSEIGSTPDEFYRIAMGIELKHQELRLDWLKQL